VAARKIDPVTRGDPESPLRWTCKSSSNLAEALRKKGHDVEDTSVRSLLQKLGYSSMFRAFPAFTASRGGNADSGGAVTRDDCG
jgi:hypothetical protein